MRVSLALRSFFVSLSSSAVVLIANNSSVSIGMVESSVTILINSTNFLSHFAERFARSVASSKNFLTYRQIESLPFEHSPTSLPFVQNLCEFTICSRSGLVGASRPDQ